MIVLFWNPSRKIIFVFRENSRNQASCEQARIQLAGKVVHGWLTEDVRDTGSWLTEQSSVSVCVRLCLCECVCGFSAAPNEISHQAESFSGSLHPRLKVRLADSADAFYSPEPAPSCQMRGYHCPPTPLLIPAPIHPLHTLPSLHYHPGPPWQGSVHLPVKLGGGRRGWWFPAECLDTLADVQRGDG